jgi:hypothetical protein
MEDKKLETQTERRWGVFFSWGCMQCKWGLFFYEPLCVWSCLLCLALLCLNNYLSTSVWNLMMDSCNRCGSLRTYRSLKGNLSDCCDDTPFPSHIAASPSSWKERRLLGLSMFQFFLSAMYFINVKWYYKDPLENHQKHRAETTGQLSWKLAGKIPHTPTLSAIVNHQRCQDDCWQKRIKTSIVTRTPSPLRLFWPKTRPIVRGEAHIVLACWSEIFHVPFVASRRDQARWVNHEPPSML